MENNRKNVLLTTMSILTFMSKLNYYYFEDKTKKYFTNGISQLEQGSKYFLSKYPIDEIVVIGTDETIMKTKLGEVVDDQVAYESLLDGWDVLKESYDERGNRKSKKFKHGISAYEFYKYRIAAFLREKGQVGKGLDEAAADLANEQIAEVRKEDLRKIYEEICPENPFLMSADKNIWTQIDREVAKSIENEYIAGDYQRYLSSVDEIKQFEEQYLKNVRLAENYEQTRQDIMNDKKLTLLEKQFLIVSLKEKVNAAIAQNTEMDMKMTIAELEKERSRFEHDYNTLHNRRKDMEVAYIHYLAYSKMDPKYRMAPLYENTEDSGKKMVLRFVDEQIGEKEQVDNISNIVNTLYGDDDREINLYIDMQGGNRTSSYVRNAIVSILNNQVPAHVHIQTIIGTDFNSFQEGGNRINDETNRYQILDLVSGMNAFIRYGKADMIQKYCQQMNIAHDSDVGKLVGCMVEIDDAISLCDIQGLTDAITELRKQLSDDVKLKNDSTEFVENVFHILRDGIRNDYGKLLEPKAGNKGIDYLELINWCARKGFLQQGLTLIEDKMPSVYFNEKILNYMFLGQDAVKNKNLFMQKAGQSYEKRIENKLFYSMNFNNVGGPLFEILWKTQTPQMAQNRVSEKPADKRAFIKEQSQSLTQFRKYIEGVLIQRGYSQTKWKINEKEVAELKNDLQNMQNDEEFVKGYCRFRVMEKELEGNSNKRDLANAFTLYDIAKDRIDRHGLVTFCSILAYVGTNEFSFTEKNKGNKNNEKYNSNKQNNGSKETKMPIMLKVHPQLIKYRKLLEEVFLLHEALKQERNCSNHASEKGLRLSSKLVKRAMEIYARKMDEIMSLIKE